MAKLTFIGGIHPNDGKKMSKDKPIKAVNPKGDLIYPISQHIGAPAVPIVNVGDYVLAGQKIAEAQGFVSASIFSSVSGKVKAIEPRRIVTGDNITCIVVENDHEYKEIEYQPIKPLDELSREEIITLIKEAGIVGMGGAGFPTHVKLSPKEPDKIYYVILNGAECEPYLTSDYRIMLEESDKIMQGLRVLLRLFPHAKAIIAIENNKEDCIKNFKELVKSEHKISVRALKTKYPQGAEKQLIYATTGRAINSSMLPSDAGCVVNNIDTVVAIGQAVCEGKPLVRRIVTVTGDSIRYPQNFRVRIGTNYKELVDEAGGFAKPPVRIVSGGPMMGFGMFDLNVPTTKISSALLCLSKDEVHIEPSACINCGKCAEACPSRLLPSKLAEFADHYNEEAFLKFEGMECCECGCCSYVCPAKRQLTQSIKSMRKFQLSKRKK